MDKSCITLGSAKNGQGKTQTLERSKPPIVITSEDGKIRGTLIRLANKVCDLTLKRRLLLELRKNKIATRKIEGEAMKLELEAKGMTLKSNETKNWKMILEKRNSEKVCDLLDLKVKYCDQAEQSVRQEYKEVKEIQE